MVAGRMVSVLALAGGAGSGKTTVACALAVRLGAGVVHLDDCHHTDVRRAPSVPAFGGAGCVVDFSDPRSSDVERVEAALPRCGGAGLVVVEGLFALAVDRIRARAAWRVFVDAPADGRLARQTLRKIDQGRNPVHVLRRLPRTRPHRPPTTHSPQPHPRHLTLNDMQPVDDLVDQVCEPLGRSRRPQTSPA